MNTIPEHFPEDLKRKVNKHLADNKQAKIIFTEEFPDTMTFTVITQESIIFNIFNKFDGIDMLSKNRICKLDINNIIQNAERCFEEYRGGEK